MINTDEQALICDLAESYRIYDYRQLPADTVAVFSCGLKGDSRIKMRMAGQSAPFDSLLLAGIVDRLSILIWMKTKDGQKGKNQPVSVVAQLTAEIREKSEVVFDSGKEFEEERERLLRKIGGESAWQQS